MLVRLFLLLFPSPNQPVDYIVDKREPVNEVQVPWSASLIAFKEHYEHAICSAFLLTPLFAGTATHCTNRPYLEQGKFRFKVGLGSGDAENQTVKRTVVELYRHPNYTQNQHYKKNDITLLKLFSEIKFTDNVQPIKLPAMDKIGKLEGLLALSASYGLFHPTHSPKLNRIDIRILPNKTCAEIDSRFEKEIHLCAESYHGNGTGPCTGDGGSALALGTGEEFIIIGITSFNANKHDVCYDGTPIVYTRITHYLPWINEILNKHGVENKTKNEIPT